jgi:hypothetical protein
MFQHHSSTEGGKVREAELRSDGAKPGRDWLQFSFAWGAGQGGSWAKRQATPGSPQTILLRRSHRPSSGVPSRRASFTRVPLSYRT